VQRKAKEKIITAILVTKTEKQQACREKKGVCVHLVLRTHASGKQPKKDKRPGRYIRGS
jgi:hypothetical protein